MTDHAQMLYKEVKRNDYLYRGKSKAYAYNNQLLETLPYECF